jgi:peptidoglycan/xylan/chitin deacetylase (PgdA/CDA1 family)
MYHEVYVPEERERLRRLTNPAYNTELGLFRKQMAFLSDNNISTLTIDALLSRDSTHEGEAVCLTFDDGWLGNYLHAYPILQEHGFKATFFVATDLIGKPLYMTWDQLRKMQSSGMSIQSHTVSHRPLGGMEEKEILFELSDSKKIIEKMLCSVVRHLSLPHGYKEVGVWAVAQKIGHQSICTSDVGFARKGSQGPWLKRISIGDSVSEKQFRLIVEGKYRGILGMMLTKTMKNTLRRIVGVHNYRRLYRRVYGIR